MERHSAGDVEHLVRGAAGCGGEVEFAEVGSFESPTEIRLFSTRAKAWLTCVTFDQGTSETRCAGSPLAPEHQPVRSMNAAAGRRGGPLRRQLAHDGGGPERALRAAVTRAWGCQYWVVMVTPLKSVWA